MDIRRIAAKVHGRYLVVRGGGERLLVGFHGYAENAERHLKELEQLPGIDRWSVLAVQALHPFYNTKTGEVIANWMTSQDREQAIEDNLAYVGSILNAVARPRTLLFAGFSQGAAMAYRAAAHFHCDGLLILGGDLPPDVRGARLPPILLGRGKADDWYTDEKLTKDLSFLPGDVTTVVFDGGHEWSDAYREAAGKFLARF